MGALDDVALLVDEHFAEDRVRRVGAAGARAGEHRGDRGGEDHAGPRVCGIPPSNASSSLRKLHGVDAKSG